MDPTIDSNAFSASVKDSNAFNASVSYCCAMYVRYNRKW